MERLRPPSLVEVSRIADLRREFKEERRENIGKAHVVRCLLYNQQHLLPHCTCLTVGRWQGQRVQTPSSNVKTFPLRDTKGQLVFSIIYPYAQLHLVRLQLRLEGHSSTVFGEISEETRSAGSATVLRGSPLQQFDVTLAEDVLGRVLVGLAARQGARQVVCARVDNGRRQTDRILQLQVRRRRRETVRATGATGTGVR